MLNVAEAPLFSKTSGRSSEAQTELWLNNRVEDGLNGIYSRKVLLTPDLARALLKRNESNRNLRPHVLSGLMADIVSGNWRLNGETIIVSAEGLLNDGQHRCVAVDRTNRSVETVIVFGVDRDSRTTVDAGTARTVGDQIAMEGGSNAHMGGAVAKMLIQFEGEGVVSAHYDKRPTTAMQREKYWQHEAEIVAAIKSVPRRGSMRIGSKSFVSFVAVLLRRKDEAAANKFIEQLCIGDGLTKTDPIYWARERLSDPNGSKRLTTMERLEIVVRHWNNWRRGARMSKCSQLQNVIPEII